MNLYKVSENKNIVIGVCKCEENRINTVQTKRKHVTKNCLSITFLKQQPDE